MRKYLILSIALVAGLLLSSCDNNSTNPEPVSQKGSIYVTSSPSGAQIWVDGTNSNKVTPDSVTNINEGNHSVTLKLDGYRDTTLTNVNVVAGYQTAKNVVLSSDISIVKYGPVKLWETTGTSVDQPSGLDLSTGQAYGVSGSNKDMVDIYYSSNGFVVKSADNVNNRITSFLVGNASNLDDAVNSPLATNSWVTQINDTETNYAFLFDADLHYSKLKITNRGGGTPGNPAWVEVTYYYNNTANDVRFK